MCLIPDGKSATHIFHHYFNTDTWACCRTDFILCLYYGWSSPTKGSGTQESYPGCWYEVRILCNPIFWDEAVQRLILQLVPWCASALLQHWQLVCMVSFKEELSRYFSVNCVIFAKEQPLLSSFWMEMAILELSAEPKSLTRKYGGPPWPLSLLGILGIIITR